MEATEEDEGEEAVSTKAAGAEAEGEGEEAGKLLFDPPFLLRSRKVSRGGG